MKQLIAFLASLHVASGALAASLEEDVQRYIAVFQGNDAAAHNKSVEELAWMGLSDPRLFDMLEQKVLAEAKAAANTRAEKDRVARYMRALGFSGQDKYMPTLLRFQDDMIYGRYARDALIQREQYRKWNPIISSRASFDPQLSDDDNRIMNMLHSDDLVLMRLAAKRAYFAPNDRTLALMADEVRKRYLTSEIDPDRLDAIAWMVKALSKTIAYDDLLQEVRSNAPDRKVRNTADSALRHAR
jgi:hypothetical protein